MQLVAAFAELLDDLRVRDRIVATAPALSTGPHALTVVNAWGVETPDGKQIQVE